MTGTKWRLTTVLLLVASTNTLAAAATTLLAGRLLDVRDGALLGPQVITIEDGVIVDITPAEVVSAGDVDIDLSGHTVLPGLIDTHTHLADVSYMGDDFDHYAHPAATFGILGVTAARTTLHAGFTTVRDISAPWYVDVALRDAIEAGWIEGPRMQASGAMITMTGGHGTWGNWMGPQHRYETDAHVQADGVDAVRQAVRRHIQKGVDVIKVAATGGFGTSGSKPGAASYTAEELRAAVEEAHKNGLRVAAHAHGAAGVRNAIEAGVDSIEHASMIDDAGIRALKRSGTWLVMDLLAARFDLVERDADFSDKIEGSNADEFANYMRLFGKAHEAGVKMAFGSDAGIYPHGRNAEQFALMVEAGMSTGDAIRSATIRAAELMGLEDEIGEVVVGKAADLVAVRGNPLEDIRVLEQVAFVMQAGKVVVTAGPATAPDERAVRAVADAALNAIRERDEAGMQALFLPEGMSTRVRAVSDTPLRQMKNADFIAQAFGGDQSLEERWAATPLVRVSGDVATVWGRYTFHVDGAVAHCGVNAVDLVRIAGDWKIANWTWSVETEGCTSGR